MIKRIISIFLCLVLMLGLFTGCGETESTVDVDEDKDIVSDEPLPELDAELMRAYKYGLLPDDWAAELEGPVTHREYFELVRTVLSAWDSSRLVTWRKMTYRAAESDEVMLREDAMLMLSYAWVLMGRHQEYPQNMLDEREYPHLVYTEEIRESNQGVARFEYPLYENWSDGVYTIYGGANYMWGAVCVFPAVLSPVSGMPMFQWDENGSLHLADDISRADAALALLRMADYCKIELPIVHDVPDPPYLTKLHWFTMDTDKSVSDNNLMKLQANAPDVSAQREQIINSKTNIVKSDTFVQGETYTGTAYYVSNSGNDSNSGTSPNEAWVSLDKVNSTKFSRGDAVFFERGGTWYGDIRPRADDMTYSAYGEGAKPIISGNEPEAMKPERWREYGKTPDGGTVWVFENALTDSAQILLGEERTPAIRFCPDIKDGVFVNSEGGEFDPLEMFVEDLSFFSKADIFSQDINKTLSDLPRNAELYLRCDAGNPAEVFGKIEFMYSLMGVWNEYCGIAIENLDIRNFGALAVSGGNHRMLDSQPENYELAPGILVQNCEISYCGGFVSEYMQREDRLTPTFSGGALQLSANGNRAVNNYFHDINSKVFVIAHHGQFGVQGPGYSGIEIRGNLLENCCAALHLTDYSYSIGGSEQPCYFNVDFVENTVLYSGYGWYREQNRRNEKYYELYDMNVLDICGTPHEKDDINISDNLFYGAELLLISNTSGRSHDAPNGLSRKEINFSGNSYAQYGNLGRISEDCYVGTDLEKFAKEILGDETAIIYGE